MATKKQPSKPKLSAEARAKMAERARKQWADAGSKLRTRHREGQRATRRPPPKHAVKLIELACGKFGASITAIARVLQCHPSTLTAWRQRHPEIEEAIQRGRIVEEDALWGVLHKAAVVDGNITAAIVALKMKFHHRDSGPIPGEKPDDPVEMAAKIRAALKQMDAADGIVRPQ